ncbi:MAG: hypothetical protein NTV36_03520 [Candidatus Staskawiczbacteria bacterium]|nr:hypothetical protein [Candidatus Staskawiczbacteria bacterium]
MNQDKHKGKFPGFPPEPTANFWRYPKCLNGWWHMLSGTEQKVLDYIVRHTWGYNKTADKISISEFKNGIQNKKTGIWVDRGIGIKKDQAIINAIKRLSEVGFIEVIKKTGKTTEIKLLTNGNTTLDQKSGVATDRKSDTINDFTIDNKQYNFFNKKKKPYFQGNPMRFVNSKQKWYVIKNGEWLIQNKNYSANSMQPIENFLVMEFNHTLRPIIQTERKRIGITTQNQKHPDC